jgi:hypothetical protein
MPTASIPPNSARRLKSTAKSGTKDALHPGKILRGVMRRTAARTVCRASSSGKARRRRNPSTCDKNAPSSRWKTPTFGDRVSKLSGAIAYHYNTRFIRARRATTSFHPLSGGSGSRLWPMSRLLKQFLPLTSGAACAGHRDEPATFRGHARHARTASTGFGRRANEGDRVAGCRAGDATPRRRLRSRRSRPRAASRTRACSFFPRISSFKTYLLSTPRSAPRCRWPRAARSSRSGFRRAAR